MYMYIYTHTNYTYIHTHTHTYTLPIYRTHNIIVYHLIVCVLSVCAFVLSVFALLHSPFLLARRHTEHSIVFGVSRY
jgi:hypothetical protein